MRVKITGVLWALAFGQRPGEEWNVVCSWCLCHEGRILRWDRQGGGCCRNPLGVFTACGQGWEAFRWHELMMTMTIVCYKRRKMLEVVMWSLLSGCEVVMVPLLWCGQDDSTSDTGGTLAGA